MLRVRGRDHATDGLCENWCVVASWDMNCLGAWGSGAAYRASFEAKKGEGRRLKAWERISINAHWGVCGSRKVLIDMSVKCLK